MPRSRWNDHKLLIKWNGRDIMRRLTSVFTTSGTPPGRCRADVALPKAGRNKKLGFVLVPINRRLLSVLGGSICYVVWSYTVACDSDKRSQDGGFRATLCLPGPLLHRTQIIALLSPQLSPTSIACRLLLHFDRVFIAIANTGVTSSQSTPQSPL